ncbi:MAG: AmmeMemoRadiSam system radical SAM enzyme [Candidatus Aminicenantes bacterium]|nr:AmmeMemoRadiSam system radical SAM enzyme [Candidatus Aminicenantes bacterium]
MIKEAMLFKALEGGRTVCALCSHRCDIAPGKFGVCGVRENRGGRLMTHAYGEVIAAHVDPIEKKPFFHFLPDTTSFSIATIGCNFRCSFCQNWQISQAAKTGHSTAAGAPGIARGSTSAAKARPLTGRGEELSPEDAVRIALDRGCRSISYTYTEPTVFFEYAYDTAKLARESGLANTFVTNGFMTAEALETIRPYLDAANVDLKAFRDETYKKVCQARLGPVLDSIRLMHDLGIWVEVTTLVVPGLNDGDAELGDMARFIAGVDPDIPWHISRFHPDYNYTDAEPTPVETLRRAFAIGQRADLRYVYIGNVSGEGDTTRCPHCFRPLIQRRGFRVEENRVRDGACPYCRTPIAGLFQ